jgi:hypothetical protein
MNGWRKSWRVLARSFQFVESYEQFLVDSQKNRDSQSPNSLDEED